MEVAVSSTARLYSPEKVIGRAGEAMRLLMEAGLTFEALQMVIDDPEMRKRVAMYWLARGTIPSASQARAQKIMGGNYISPAEVTRFLRYNYTRWDLKELECIPYPEALLKQCKDTHVLVPGIAVNIRELQHYVPRDVFMWSRLDNVDDSERRKTRVAWYLLRKEILHSSRIMRLHEQEKSLGEDETLPEMCEVAYIASLFELARGERLFQDNWVTTRPSGTCFGSGESWDFGVVVGRPFGGILTTKRQDYYGSAESGLAPLKRPLK